MQPNEDFKSNFAIMIPQFVNNLLTDIRELQNG